MIHPGTQALDAILNQNEDRAHDLLRQMTLPQLDLLVDAVDKLGSIADDLAIQKLDGDDA